MHLLLKMAPKNPAALMIATITQTIHRIKEMKSTSKKKSFPQKTTINRNLQEVLITQIWEILTLTNSNKAKNN